MITLGDYFGTNVVYFPNFFLDLDYEGITLIRGTNLNSSLPNRNNASGKSLLVAGIADVLTNSCPVLTPGDSRSKKDLYGKGASISLSVNGVAIRKLLNGSTLAYEIPTDNGTEVVKPDAAESVIWQQFPITTEEFYTRVFLDSRRPFTLHMGTATDRTKFMTGLAQLDGFNDLYDHFRGLQRQVSQDVVTLEALKSTQTQPTASEEEIAEATIKRKKLRKRISELQDQIEVMTFKLAEAAKMSEARATSNRVRKLLQQIGVTGTPEDVQRAYREHIQKDKSKVLGQYESQYEDYRDYVSRLKDLKKTAKRLGITMSDPDMVRDVVSLYRKALSEIDDSLDLDELKAAITGTKKINRDTRLAELADVRSRIKLYEASAKPSDGDSCCALCGSDVGGEFAAFVSRKLKEARKEELRVVRDLDMFRLLDKYPEVVSLITDAEYESAEELRESIVAAQKVRKRQLEFYSDYPKPLTEPVINPKLKEEQKAWEERNRVWAQIEPLLDGLTENVDSDPVDTETLSSQLKDARSKLERLNESMASVREFLSVQTAGAATATDTKERIIQLEARAKHAPVIKALVDAYGNKGIKVNAMSAVCTKLQHLMNSFSNTVFPEPMYFEFVVEANRFDILAYRNPGTDGERVSDVRTLSGAEGRAFNLLVALALMPMLPEHRRVNVIILDEMTSHMDRVTKELVYERYIPILHSFVPHVIVLDTGNLPLSGARELYVQKEGGTSKLIGVEE
jgi:phage shock protein A